MTDNKQPDVKCPLCGGEAQHEKSLVNEEGFTIFICSVCHVSFVFSLPLAEALARFQQRPESAWGMFKRLSSIYGKIFYEALYTKLTDFINEWINDADKYNQSISLLQNMSEQKAIVIMQQIEKELKE